MNKQLNLQKDSDRIANAEIEITLNWLDESFERLLALKDLQQQEEAIAREAEKLGLSYKLYRKEFERYQNAQKYLNSSQTSILLKPVSLVDAKVADFVEWFQNISFVKLAAVLSESALLFALISYAIGIPHRNNQRIQEARQVLLEESERKYSEARIAALKVLQDRCAGNPGLEAPESQLIGVKLTGCSRLSLSWKLFGQWPPKWMVMTSLDLSNSHLAEADLTGSDLEGINLQGSNLKAANLAETNLKEANLAGANLEGANLARANLEGANLQNAILDRSNFYGANFQNADFSEASLVEVKALWANFVGANFYRANLQAANLTRSRLQDTDFYKANLQDALLRFANLKAGEPLGGANFRGAELTGADFRGARFSSVFQIQRGKNWENARKIPNWKRKIAVARLPRLRIALIKPTVKQTLFEAYELGMRRAANRRVEIWAFESEEGVEHEARTIRELIDFGIDAIVLTPKDPEQSIPALQEANDAGIAIITVDFCFDRQIAKDLAIACYNTDSYQMGYDSGEALVKWAKNHLRDRDPQTERGDERSIRLGLVDGAAYDRYYPYLQGVRDAIKNSDVPLQIVDSVGIEERSDISRVATMLKNFPDIDILWGGSNLATEVAIEGVDRLNFENRVAVFGILDLSRDKAQMLLDPHSPLQLIIDQAGVQIGYDAATLAIAVLRGERPGEEYEEFVPPHRLLTQDNKEEVRELLREVNSID
ncbi:MAG: pentapeptide repeat-containing protein [Spirulina sp.]